jgi:hydrogenase maturation protease
MTTKPAGVPRVLLLGLGNDLLSDDAIGLRIVADVRPRVGALRNVTVIGSTQMGVALLDLVLGYHELLIVDAIQTGKADPGFLHELELSALKTLPTMAPHFLGVGEMLALGLELGLAIPRRTRILAVEVADPFTMGTHLTPLVEAALPNIVNRLVTLLQQSAAVTVSTVVAN